MIRPGDNIVALRDAGRRRGQLTEIFQQDVHAGLRSALLWLKKLRQEACQAAGSERLGDDVLPNQI